MIAKDCDTGGLVDQEVSRSPSTAGFPNSSLGNSTWLSRGLGRFSSGFLQFSPSRNIHSTISSHWFIWFHFFCPCDVATGVIARNSCISLTNIWDSTRPCVGHELRRFIDWFIYLFLLIVTKSTAVDQAVAFAPVTQWAQVRSPVRTSFLGEVFSGFFLTRKTNVWKR